MSQILDATLVIAALRMALGRRRPAKTLILHSDRGAQFASAAYRQVLAQHGLVPSMSHKANCYDNAFIESFFSSLKYELVYHYRFATRAQARTAIFGYIETFYTIAPDSTPVLTTRALPILNPNKPKLPLPNCP